MSEKDIVAAFAGASVGEWLEISRNISQLQIDLDALYRASRKAWIASHDAQSARQAGGSPDRVHDLDERAVEQAKAAKAAAKNARVKMDNLKLTLNLYEL